MKLLSTALVALATSTSVVLSSPVALGDSILSPRNNDGKGKASQRRQSRSTFSFANATYPSL